MLRRRRQDSKQENLFSIGMLTSALLVIFVTGAVSFFVPSVARAISFDYGLGDTLGFGTADLLETVIGIVQWALGLLGLVAVIIIMYGGFIWMTAQGNQDKIEKAKKIIFNGLIGLAIILLSWAIVFFVSSAIDDATSGGTTFNCGGLDCTGSQLCCAPNMCALSCGSSFPTDLAFTGFEVSRDPGGDVYQCSGVKATFNANIDPATVESAELVDNLRTHDVAGGAPFNAPSGDDFVTGGNSITYYHNDLFPVNTDYEEWYPTAGTPPTPIQDYGSRIISDCGTLGCSSGGDPAPWVWPFHVGFENDVAPPEIVSSYPINTADAGYPDRNVSRAPIFAMNFGEPIDDNTIIGAGSHPNGNFELWECTDSACSGYVGQYNNNNLLAQAVPNGVNIFIEDPALNPLEPFTWYELRVHDIEDLCGNPMAAPEIWSFQTNDSVPGISSWYPTGGNICPSTDIYITFGTSMFYETVMIEINNGSDYRQMLLQPSALWPGAVEDVIPGVGTFKVTDASLPVSDNFKVFVFEPDPNLDANTHYEVDITTSMVINTDGDPLLHNWGFDVTDPASCTCSPFISNLSPSQGPVGSCLTIQGACFIGTPANPGIPTNIIFDDLATQVTVVPSGYDVVNGNYVTTRLPNAYVDGDYVYSQIELDYDDPTYGVLYSAAAPSSPPFFVNDPGPATGPCLWSINPNAGYEGAGMSANGIRFGDPQGAGEINYQSAIGTATAWNDTDISTSVPTGATDGDVTVVDDSGDVSNGIYFDVLHIPPGTPYVIMNSFCDTATLSSPSPWRDYEETCLNSNFSARFNEAMSAGTLTNTNNIYFEPCNDPSCSSFGAPISGGLSTLTIASADDTFVFNPDTNLTPDTWYQGTITTNVQNVFGEHMADPFVWKFKTQVDNTVCEIESYSMSSTTDILTTIGAVATYTNVPIGPACQLLNPVDYLPWNWGSSNPGVADIATTGGPGVGNYIAVSEGNTIVESWGNNSSAPHAFRPLTVDLTFCEDDADCSSCLGSTCVSTPTPHCSPVITGVVPATAPVGDFVTVEGCMFGGYSAGTSNIEFTGSSGLVPAIFPAVCGPAGSTWNNNSVVVEVPNEETADTVDDAISGPIHLTNEYGEISTMAGFNVGGSPTPNLCSLTPNFGAQNSPNATTATGEGFGTVSGTVHFYNDASGRSSATFSTWAESLIQGIDIPADAVTGVGVNGVMVNAGGGDSNPVNFYITCSNDAQCTTGCCSAGQCADAAVCSGGGPAAPCQLPAHPNCSSGPISPPGGYECISDTGELPMTIPIGDDCRFCCRPPLAYNGLTCLPDQGNCSGTDRGLYCGCVTDGQCGSSTTVGCGDFGGEMCCTGRPSVVSVNPFDGEGDVCMNRAVVVEFDQIMDTGTFNNLTEFEVVSDATPLVPYPGVITSYVNTGHTFLVFTPDVPWAANEPHTVTVSGDPDINDGVHLGVLNQNQVGLNGDFVSHFTADDILCNLDHVEIDVAYNPGPTTVLNASQDMYVCTRDDCPADLTGGIAGNQHGYVATAVDADLNPLTTGASYDWSNSTTNGVLNVETPGNNWTYISTLGPDGTELIRADVDLGAAGSGSATVFARVEACDNPWPNSAPYFYPDGLGILEPMNFTTYYCRDGGLPGMVNPLVYISPGASTPDNDLLREVFFSLDDTSGDVIGIRVMENESFLSPSAWFSQMFPTDTGACNPIGTVDGYQACRAGRTIYVAATNLAGGTLYKNIYLISYNDGANGQTVNIYNQLVENWFFNSDPPSLMSPCATSLLETNKACIVRDTKRVTELGEIGYLLLNYQYNNGIFPELSAGTFLSGFTTSKWPSWVAEFGNEIGISPPVDPINEFEPLCLPIPPWDPAGTCWNDDDHRFLCPAGSHVYAYSGASSNAFLFARLEYTGTGSWTNFSSDPCGGLPGSQQCQCFNYWAPSTDNFWITNWSPPI